jgi:hypothetical protein
MAEAEVTIVSAQVPRRGELQEHERGPTPRSADGARDIAEAALEDVARS